MKLNEASSIEDCDIIDHANTKKSLKDDDEEEEEDDEEEEEGEEKDHLPKL